MKYKGGNKNKYVGGDSSADTLLLEGPSTNNVNMSSENIAPKNIYNITLFALFSVVGVLIPILFGKNNNYATATVWGFSSSIFALIGLLISIFAISSKSSFSQGVFGFLKVVASKAFPIFLILGILSFVIFQNVKFYKEINSGRVSDEYYTYAGTSSFFIIIQLLLVVRYIKDITSGSQTTQVNKGEDGMNILSSQLTSIIAILTIINISFIGMLQVILQYFSTDG
jgi:hypothetical protein